jgi:hypothetical protein
MMIIPVSVGKLPIGPDMIKRRNSGWITWRKTRWAKLSNIKYAIRVAATTTLLFRKVLCIEFTPQGFTFSMSVVTHRNGRTFEESTSGLRPRTTYSVARRISCECAVLCRF